MSSTHASSLEHPGTVRPVDTESSDRSWRFRGSQRTSASSQYRRRRRVVVAHWFGLSIPGVRPSRKRSFLQLVPGVPCAGDGRSSHLLHLLETFHDALCYSGDFTESGMRMPNIGTVLKEEITRLSRKEVRSQVDPTRKATATHRRDIAALKRQVASLERRVTLLLRKGPGGARPEVSVEATAKPIRFSAKRLQSQRSRLGLSAIDFGRLLGVSAQTIYNWEHEVARPRVEQPGKLAALRGVGKRAAGERLKQWVATTSSSLRKASAAR